MSVTPDKIRRLAELGLSPEQIAGAIEILSIQSARQARNARYYQKRKATENVLIKTPYQATENVLKPTENVLALARVDDNLTKLERTGNKKKKEISSAIASEFEERFWPAYPKRKDKQPALLAFIKARKIATLDEIMFGVEKYALERSGEEEKFTKYAQGWLNDRKWQNYSPPKPLADEPKEFVPTDWPGANLLRVRYQNEHNAAEPATMWIDGREGSYFPASWVAHVKTRQKEMHS